MTINFEHPTPVVRIFDLARAKEFYCGWLGMTVDWEAQPFDNAPLYLQVSRGKLVLHLSEHHGDGTPGTVVYVRMSGIGALHAELTAKNYRFNRPGLIDVSWGGRELHIIDPFSNSIRFHEPA